MIDSSSTDAAVRRHHLTTFGALALTGPGNEPVLGDHGHHRRRLASSHIGALERLARSAGSTGDLESASRWWHALTDADPLSSRYAAGRIRSLVTLGDRAAALQFARCYEALVAQELGTSVDPAITALVNEVRRSVSMARADEPPPAAAAQQVGDAGARPAAPVPPEPPLAASERLDPASPPPGARRNRAFALVAALTVIVVAGVALWRSRGDAGMQAAEPRTASIAVLPLANVGGAQEDAALVNGVNEEPIAMLSKLR